MSLLHFEHSGRRYFLAALTFQADLDIGWSGTAVLQEPLLDIQRGSIVKISLANRSFDVVIQEFHTPWKDQGRQWVTFTDPVQASRRFGREVFCEPRSNISDEQVVRSRIPCQGPECFIAPRWPHVVIDGLTAVEVLHAICSRESNWHFRWIDGQVIVGPLPDTDPIELPSSNEADVDGGFEADFDLAIPMLGDRVQVRCGASSDGKSKFRTGVVVQLRIDYPRHLLACRARIVEEGPAAINPIQATGSTYFDTILSQLEPLATTILAHDGASQLVRIELFTLKSEAIQLKMPLRTNDPLLLEWPVHSITTEPLRAFPFGRSDVSEQLQVVLSKPLDFRSANI